MAVSVSVLALLTLAACGTESGSGDGDGGEGGGGTVRSDVPVTGVPWSVDSVTAGGTTTEAPPGARLEIDAKGRATGDLGCNRVSADARVDGDRITVKRAVTTEMACDQNVQKFEQALLRVLNGELTAELSGRKLTLTAPDGDRVALSEEPPAALLGTRWEVGTLLDGKKATAVPADLPAGSVPYLTLSKDGTVQGNSGCNTFRATAEAGDRTITFGPAAGTRKLCPEPAMEVERAVLAALDGRAAYTVEGGTLTLTAADGQGLAATAAAPRGPRTLPDGG
ncbi:META domain-containing protein [Streptomyces sp. NPDC088729]|uniref:META domain-containing protein n=1 Tax=Streptomyces sp. NPDC088729 TaxID=3365876 RepID=UPI00382EAE38